MMIKLLFPGIKMTQLKVIFTLKSLCKKCMIAVEITSKQSKLLTETTTY